MSSDGFGLDAWIYRGSKMIPEVGYGAAGALVYTPPVATTDLNGLVKQEGWRL